MCASQMPTKRQATVDVSVVLGCSTLFVVSRWLDIRIGWIIPVVAVVLLAYVFLVLRPRGHTWRDYGLRRDNLASAAWQVGIWTLVAAGVLISWAIYRGNSLMRPEMILLLPIYPLWGIIQQLIFQGILHRALLVLAPANWMALILNSLAFGAVHLYDWRIELLLLTLVAGFFWSWFYQRCPNIWVLGVSHGILAGLTYPLLLADNPLERIF